MIHLLLAIALVLLVVSVVRLIPYLRARSWVPSTGTVLSVKEHWANVRYSVYWRLKCFYPVIEYQYQFSGRNYTSNRVSFEKQNIWLPEVDSFGMPNDETKKFWAGWSKGAAVPIFINPKDPSQSVIVKELGKKRKSHHLALLTGGMLLAALWALLVVFNLTIGSRGTG